VRLRGANQYSKISERKVNRSPMAIGSAKPIRIRYSSQRNDDFSFRRFPPNLRSMTLLTGGIHPPESK
jgi:hypothetical protein